MTRTPLTATTVIAEAADLADETGFDTVTLSAVARRLTVRTPSLYSHIRDRDALLDGIAALALTELATNIGKAIAGRSGREALAAFATAYRTYARTSPGRWQSLQRKTGETVAQSTAARDVVTLTGALLRGYAIPEEEHVHAVRLLGSTINGYLALERNGSFDHSDPPPAQSWTRIIDALDALLQVWPNRLPPS